MTNPAPIQRANHTNTLLLFFVLMLAAATLIMVVRIHAKLDPSSVTFKGRSPAVPPAEAGESPAPSSKPQPAAQGAKSPAPGATSPAAFVTGWRSPLPQEGEDFSTPLPARLLITPVESAQPAAAAEKDKAAAPAEKDKAEPAPAEGDAVSWEDAGKHIGKTVTVTGKIVATRKLPTICFLNFTKEQGGGDKFYLVVFKDEFGDYEGGPDKFFLNKTVKVKGLVENHNGRPQLKIKKKEQVIEAKAE